MSSAQRGGGVGADESVSRQRSTRDRALRPLVSVWEVMSSRQQVEPLPHSWERGRAPPLGALEPTAVRLLGRLAAPPPHSCHCCHVRG